MEKIVIDLGGERIYPIFIGSKLFASCDPYLFLKSGDVVVLITDDHVASKYLGVLQKSLKCFNVFLDQLVLPAGESSKSLNMLEYVITELLHKNYNRNVILFALGGGVIGDLVGFIAATYQRGVRFVQLPTTLLAQVDASIGGKTAVNHRLAKNMIGVFYQPISVVINLDCLSTLPPREFSSGLAEVIKYGVAFDSIFFEWLELHLEEVLKLDPVSLLYCVRRCCELKSNIVKEDEYDDLRKGVRVLLNLGHTYAHAIESFFKYSGECLHGEAVSIGIIMAANLSYIMGYLTDFDVKRIRSLLLRAGLPVNAPNQINIIDYLPFMLRDKKNISDKLCLVLPITIGKAKVCTDVSQELIKLSINIDGL